MDGQENPVATIWGAKLHEVQKYMTLTNHQYNPQSVVISKKFWDTLSADEKKIISDAVADVGPLVRQAMAQHPGFEDVGKRMLMAWAEGVQGLRDQRVYAVGDWVAGEAFEGFSAPPKLSAETNKIGRSPLLGER